jgi:hypothetical protein
VDDKDFNENITYSEPTKGSVSCSTFWNSSELQVNLTSTVSSNTTRGLPSTDCTHLGTVSLQYDLQYGESKMFSCIVKFPPYDPILYVRQITVEEGR